MLWGSGQRSPACSPKLLSSDVGSTKQPTFSTRCLSGSTVRRKRRSHEIYGSETRSDAETQIDKFVGVYGDKYPKAVAKLTKDRGVLLTFYDFPAAHWVHLRTTNPIESTFATVRARTRVTKGAGSRRRDLMMAYKLLDAAQQRWRKVNSPQLVAHVRAGIEFKDGIQVERRNDRSRDAA